ncbi:MAG: hypothetical protein MUE73_17585, partial [Planctomycetes bacterium]|nr:hypothetical protein [Planctomycetota bacterium]
PESGVWRNDLRDGLVDLRTPDSRLLEIVAFFTEASVIDEILRHLEANPPEDLFHARDPPAA